MVIHVGSSTAILNPMVLILPIASPLRLTNVGRATVVHSFTPKLRKRHIVTCPASLADTALIARDTIASLIMEIEDSSQRNAM